MRPTVAAFDVDGTITVRDCVVPFLRRVAGTARLARRLACRPVAVGSSLAHRDRDRLKAIATRAAFAGRPLGQLDMIARQFAGEVYDNNLRADVVAALRHHLAVGDTVVLVSASYEVYLRPLADRLGVEHVLATRLAVDAAGTLTGELDGPNCRAGEKVRRLEQWLTSNGRRRAEVRLRAYGDSAGDHALLMSADEGVWVGRGHGPAGTVLGP